MILDKSRVLIAHQRLPSFLLDADHPDSIGWHQRACHRGIVVHRDEGHFIALCGHFVMSFYQRLRQEESRERGEENKEGETWFTIPPLVLKTSEVELQQTVIFVAD